MKSGKYVALLLMITAIFISCRQTASTNTQAADAINGWKRTFNETLPLLGHRNWIIIADKAFPWQNAGGIEYINTNEKLLPVLDYVLKQVNASPHVKPIIYRDKELNFITQDQSNGIKNFAAQSQQLFGGQPVQTLLHDSVFSQLDAASKLFKIVVLKTNETLPYTSVFLQLDCKYWDSKKEAQLREVMKEE